MNVREHEERTSGAGLASIIVNPLLKLISLLNFGHSVHPENPPEVANSEFVSVKKYRLRVLHLVPSSSSSNRRRNEAEEKRFSKRHSLTEEYWFTRWNKPLQTPFNRCSCSFRRSQRYSLKLTEEEQHVADDNNKVSNFDAPPTKIKDFTTFVERLIEETILEALQEFIVSKESVTNSTNAYDNLAFEKDTTDGAVSVTIRKKPKKEESNKKICKHNSKNDQKPFAFLLHGIGNTADVWYHVIESLLLKGFEIAAPDMLGHGLSSAPNKRRAYKFKNLLESTLAVFDHYATKNENRKFVVIGHSFGCSLATALARYRSQQVVQLVLISGGGPTALSAPLIGNEISVFSSLQLLISPLLFCGIKRSFFYATRGKHFKPCVEDTSIPKYVFEYIDKEQNWPEGDATFHRRILIPTLLVHGLKDTQVTLVQECEMERTIPRAFLELIPTAGHMAMVETPEQLSHMILCFVDWWAR